MISPEAEDVAALTRRQWCQRLLLWLESDQGRMARQFAVFVSVGVASALLDVATLAGLMRLGLHYSLATTIAFFTALIFNYLAHARVTFKTESSARTMFRYGVIVLVNYGVTMGMVTASEIWLGGVIIGKIASLPVLAAIGFLSSRYWIFL